MDAQRAHRLARAHPQLFATTRGRPPIGVQLGRAPARQQERRGSGRGKPQSGVPRSGSQDARVGRHSPLRNEWGRGRERVLVGHRTLDTAPTHNVSGLVVGIVLPCCDRRHSCRGTSGSASDGGRQCRRGRRFSRNLLPLLSLPWASLVIEQSWSHWQGVAAAPLPARLPLFGGRAHLGARSMSAASTAAGAERQTWRGVTAGPDNRLHGLPRAVTTWAHQSL